MDGLALKNDPIGTWSGPEACVSGAAGGGAGPGASTRGAATAQTTRTSAASTPKKARAKKSDRLPQKGLIYPILPRKRLQHYTSFEGGRLS